MWVTLRISRSYSSSSVRTTPSLLIVVRRKKTRKIKRRLTMLQLNHQRKRKTGLAMMLVGKIRKKTIPPAKKEKATLKRRTVKSVLLSQT